MDILERLRDPCLVADFQHYFGIRRKEDGKVYIPADMNEVTSVEKSECTFMDWYLQDQTATKGLKPRTSKLSAPEVEYKTHVRHGSATSVASDSCVERGKPSFIEN